MHRRVRQVAAEERLTDTPSDLVSEAVRRGKNFFVKLHLPILWHFRHDLFGKPFIVVRALCVMPSGIQLFTYQKVGT